MNRLLLLVLCSCATAAPVLPLREGGPAKDDLVLVWVGQGLAERQEGGAWVRVPEFDYEFSVEQHRRGSRWESVKHLHRRHPAYDGSAGPRDQTLFFAIDYEKDGTAHISSSLGAGQGKADVEVRETQLELLADISAMAPFDRYRITQHYRYEQGLLEELVELNKGAQPWVRNREQAVLYAPGTFATAPTRLIR